MNLEEKAINKSNLPLWKPPPKTRPKYSLKDHSFHQRINKPQSSRCSQKQASTLAGFLSFMSRHNSNLAKKGQLTKVAGQRTGEEALWCFEGCNQSSSSQKYFSDIKTRGHQATSTLSSSNLSEIATDRPANSRALPSKENFKINTMSLWGNLIREGNLSSRLELGRPSDSTKEDTNLSISLRTATVSKKMRKISLDNIENKQQKISLRRRANNHKQIEDHYDELERKESLNYEQLCNPLVLSRQLQLDIAQAQSTTEGIYHSPRVSLEAQNLTHRADLLGKWLRKIQIQTQCKVSIDMKTLIQIDKDIHRTPVNSNVDIAQYQQNLRNLLVSYCLARPEIGYVQGMNNIASAVLYHCLDYNQSSALFSYLMVDSRFQTIYENQFSLVTRLTQQLGEEIKKYSTRLSQHISKCGVELQILARGWYLSMLSSFVPLAAMDLVIDKFLEKQFRGINQVILTLLIYLKEELLEADPCEVVVRLSASGLRARAEEIDWEQLVSCSQNLFLPEIPH